MWQLDADHPDKNGLQLRKLAFVLKAAAKFAAERGFKFGVFWDYCACAAAPVEPRGPMHTPPASPSPLPLAHPHRLPQRSREASAKGEDDRTAEEKATFGRGLKGINEFYGHQWTHVLLVDTELPPGPKTNSKQYLKRGWCLMEYYASGIVKDSIYLISLSKLSGEETDWYEVCDKGKAGRAPPMAPAAFAVKLESGVATGEVGFTNKGDVPLVTGIYDKAFMTEMTKATTLFYASLGWDDAQAVQLCEALRHAHAHGGLRELKVLRLDSNKLGDGFVKSLVALLDEGGLVNVQELGLSCNAISDAGMRELAAAVARGGLPKCTIPCQRAQMEYYASGVGGLPNGSRTCYGGLNLDHNPGSGVCVEEALVGGKRGRSGRARRVMDAAAGALSRISVSSLSSSSGSFGSGRSRGGKRRARGGAKGIRV